MAKLCQYGKQLDSMTAQQVFDAACEHLLTQNAKSLNSIDEDCIYNGNGVCCGAAPFIKEYHSDLDECALPWADVVEQGYASSNHKSLIIDIQHIHDRYNVYEWKIELLGLSEQYNLKFNEIKC